MKKVYLSLVAFAISSVSAQELFTMKRHPGDVVNKELTSKALGTPFWTDNFDLPADWVFDNQGQTGNDFGWNINATAEAWSENVVGGIISSTSGGNFAEVSNGDPTASTPTQIPGAVYTMTTANSIDVVTLSGGNKAALSWQQSGAKFTDLQEVQVSTDGTVFTTVYDNEDREGLFATEGSAYDNPETILVNISDAIAANPSTVWIRFSVTTSTDSGIMYHWSIDDLVLSTLPDFDLFYTENYWQSGGLQYFQIPDGSDPMAPSQIAPIEFYVKVSNEGNQDLTGVSFQVLNGGTVVESSNPQTLAAGDDDSLFVTFTPTTTGTYTISRDVVLNETDDIPSNNTFPAIAPIKVGGNVYARDEGTFDGESFFMSDLNTGYEAGNYYDIFTNATLGAIDIGVSSNSVNVGKEIYGIIYTIENGQFVPQTVTVPRVIENADLNRVISLPIEGGFDMTGGVTYFVAVGCTEEFHYATSGTSLEQRALIFYPTMNDPVAGGNFFVRGTPVVRLNFGGVGVEENIDFSASLGQNAPNPFSANSIITFELLEATEVSFEIRDLSGKLVKTYNLGNLNAGTQSLEISSANLAAGAYTYTMIAGNKTATKNMIIQK